MDNNKIGKRIRQIRKENTLNQKNFAESIGISQNFLSQIEKGSYEPAKSLLISIEYRYGINQKWLMTGKGYKEKQGLISEDMVPCGENNKEFLEMMHKFKLIYKRGGEKWDMLRRLADLFSS